MTGLPDLSTRLDAVRVGSLRPLPDEGQLTGMDKQRVQGRVRVTELGLVGDEHGDPRVHGGPAKALHYFPPEGYGRLVEAAPDLDGVLMPGVLGENLSGTGLVEANVCIGDVFRVGTALAQVSRARTPCWRIDARLERPGTNLLLASLGCQGWYLRVLETGEVGEGDRMTLVDRPAPEALLQRLHQATQAHRPEPLELRELAAAEGLEPQIADRLVKRAEWLEANPAP